MRISLFLALLVFQLSACELVPLESPNDLSVINDLTIIDLTNKPIRANPDLTGWEKISDMTTESEELKFSFKPTPVFRGECGGKVFQSKIWISNLEENPQTADCHTIFQLDLDNSNKFIGGSLIAININYLIHKFPASNSNLKGYQNIRFRVFNGDTGAPEERAIGILTGYDISAYPYGRPEHILLKIPFSKTPYSSLLIDFESKIFDKTAILETASKNPAFLIINSVRQINTP